jgi:hypothetical protein
MGCPIKHLTIKYLGLPLSVKKPTKLDYLPLLQKVQGRFRGSIDKWLSKGGRLTLINVTINALPLHYMQAFKLPAWLIKHIERVKMRFLWKWEDRAANGHYLVRWKKVCLLKINGGLGVLDLWTRNFALLLKWLWLVYHKRDPIFLMG